MTHAEVINKVKKLRPSKYEISQFTAVTPYGNRSNFSIYTDETYFYVAKGFIFNVRQNHEVIEKSKNYDSIIAFFEKQTK
jgi:hypothetical protein